MWFTQPKTKTVLPQAGEVRGTTWSMYNLESCDEVHKRDVHYKCTMQCQQQHYTAHR